MRVALCVIGLSFLTSCWCPREIRDIEQSLDSINQRLDSMGVPDEPVSEDGGEGDDASCDVDVRVKNFPRFTMRINLRSGTANPKKIEVLNVLDSGLGVSKKTSGVVDFKQGQKHKIEVYGLNGSGTDATVKATKQGGSPEDTWVENGTSAYSKGQISVGVRETVLGAEVQVDVHYAGERVTFKFVD